MDFFLFEGGGRYGRGLTSLVKTGFFFSIHVKSTLPNKISKSCPNMLQTLYGIINIKEQVSDQNTYASFDHGMAC